MSYIGDTTYVALLRAVNVGGTGKLPMAELRMMAQEVGFAGVRTYIASGNLLFESALSESEVKAALEQRLESFAGKPVPVLIRTATEMSAVLAANPLPDAQGSRHLVYFLYTPPPTDTLETVRDQADERIALGVREIYVDYGAGIRFTRLKMPALKIGTARNIQHGGKIGGNGGR